MAFSFGGTFAIKYIFSNKPLHLALLSCGSILALADDYIITKVMGGLEENRFPVPPKGWANKN